MSTGGAKDVELVASVSNGGSDDEATNQTGSTYVHLISNTHSEIDRFFQSSSGKMHHKLIGFVILSTLLLTSAGGTGGTGSEPAEEKHEESGGHHGHGDPADHVRNAEYGSLC